MKKNNINKVLSEGFISSTKGDLALVFLKDADDFKKGEVIAVFDKNDLIKAKKVVENNKNIYELEVIM